MTKKNVNVDETVEIKDDVVETMPQPQTMNYEQTIKISDNFVNDMHKALDGFSYSEVAEIFKAVDQLKDAMPINIVNEIIGRIASFPYKNVKDFMNVIETDQSRYLSLNTQVMQ